MSKGAGKAQTVTQNNDPWKGVQPYLTDLFGRAQTQSQGTGVSPTTLGLQNQLINESRSDAVAEQGQDHIQQTLAGGFSNPYTSGAMGDAMDMARSKINAQFSGDNFGNSAHQEWLGRGITAAGLPFANQAFENERGRQMQAANMAPNMAGQELARLGVGLEASQMADDSPWRQLQRYQQALSGHGGGTSTTRQPMYENKALNALGGGLAGYGALSALGTTTMLPLSAPMWGAGAGALLGLLSDKRAKENIEKVGTHKDLGVGIYTYNYKGDPVTHMGVMAQEVKEVKPEAVKKGPDGLLRVNYGEL